MGKSLKMIVEALLFSSEKPISAREINSCLPDSTISDIKSALNVLKYEYEAMGRSFKLKEVANGYQFRSRAEYGAYILRMFQTSPNRLSKAAMETLAIIAYKQPVLRHEIERLRGVDVGGILRTLLEKELIRIMGRKELPGRPLIYGTTKKFLETFDLKNISSLPKMKEIKAFGADEYEPTPTDQEEETTKQEGIATGAAQEPEREIPEPETDQGPGEEIRTAEANHEPEEEIRTAEADHEPGEEIRTAEADYEPGEEIRTAEADYEPGEGTAETDTDQEPEEKTAGTSTDWGSGDGSKAAGSEQDTSD